MNTCATDMNALRAIRFPIRLTTFSRDIFQNRHRLSPVSSATDPSQEIVMTSSRKTPRILHAVFAATPTLAAVLWATEACASQGPGGGPGTASSFTQLAMAIIVYGTSALVVGTGLIGAARRR
jgi:hypothetical protein